MGVFKKSFSDNLNIVSLVTMNIILIPLESLKRNIIEVLECNMLVVRFLGRCKEIEGRRRDRADISADRTAYWHTQGGAASLPPGWLKRPQRSKMASTL